MTFETWFAAATGHPTPRRWQCELAADPACADRLIHIPTGLGKTEGALAAWAWNRVLREDLSWPRRLVWCLPMRVLVEQTVAVARSVLERAAALRPDAPPVHVVSLMGGADVDEWYLRPEESAVLVGTQDMLLSRALNRGYASPRARWPMEYALLNQDCLWIMDEVQLMDVGLVTSVQLQAFRREAEPTALRPCRTWWMSATLQTAWLETVESAPWLPRLAGTKLEPPAADRGGPLWDVTKTVEVRTFTGAEDGVPSALARMAWEVHGRREATGPTLVVVNRVRTAMEVHTELMRLRGTSPGPDLRLVHSRYRPLDRSRWFEEFLSREACLEPGVARIIVATQVIEAGVDISAAAMVTELAPWSSLVQRFGRVARYGGSGEVLVLDQGVSGRSALPYSEAELVAAREAVSELADVGPASLDRLESAFAGDPARLKRLYPYEPLHLLTRRDLDELFDTSPDLGGADVDVSRFIRSGDERDLLVCWAPVADGRPPIELRPLRDGLCPVPVALARKWLFDGGSGREGRRAWVWDYVDDRWRYAQPNDCYPGQVFVVADTAGAYDPERGFTGEKPDRDAAPVATAGGFRLLTNGEDADAGQGRDDLSMEQWKTIATHGGEVAAIVTRLCRVLDLAPQLEEVLGLAARVHDWGKAHCAFRSSISDAADGPAPPRPDLAKAPRSAWAAPNQMYTGDAKAGRRPGFRHELATALALFALLRRLDSYHPALLGAQEPLIAAGVLIPSAGEDGAPPPNRLTMEVAALGEVRFGLLAYLACAHHGKVRASWQGTPADQAAGDHRHPLFGVVDGDELPPIPLFDVAGKVCQMPAVTLRLDPAAVGLSGRFGASWSERVGMLLVTHGPFTLTYLEALLRVADVLASRMTTSDPLLGTEEVTA